VISSNRLATSKIRDIPTLTNPRLPLNNQGSIPPLRQIFLNISTQRFDFPLVRQLGSDQWSASLSTVRQLLLDDSAEFSPTFSRPAKPSGVLFSPYINWWEPITMPSLPRIWSEKTHNPSHRPSIPLLRRARTLGFCNRFGKYWAHAVAFDLARKPSNPGQGYSVSGKNLTFLDSSGSVIIPADWAL